MRDKVLFLARLEQVNRYFEWADDPANRTRYRVVFNPFEGLWELRSVFSPDPLLSEATVSSLMAALVRRMGWGS